LLYKEKKSNQQVIDIYKNKNEDENKIEKIIEEIKDIMKLYEKSVVLYPDRPVVGAGEIEEIVEIKEIPKGRQHVVIPPTNIGVDYETEQLNKIAEIVMEIIIGCNTKSINYPDHKEVEQCIKKFQKHVSLDSKERIFMRLIYQDNESIKDAGAMVGWNKNQADGKHYRIKKHLRDVIEKIEGFIEIIKQCME